MRKEKKDLLRFQSIIENNRMRSGEDFTELLVNDLHKLLSDYFEYKGVPNVSLEKNRSVLNVNISFSASSIKSFIILPK